MEADFKRFEAWARERRWTEEAIAQWRAQRSGALEGLWEVWSGGFRAAGLEEALLHIWREAKGNPDLKAGEVTLQNVLDLVRGLSRPADDGLANDPCTRPKGPCAALEIEVPPMPECRYAKTGNIRDFGSYTREQVSQRDAFWIEVLRRAGIHVKRPHVKAAPSRHVTQAAPIVQATCT